MKQKRNGLDRVVLGCSTAATSPIAGTAHLIGQDAALSDDVDLGFISASNRRAFSLKNIKHQH